MAGDGFMILLIHTDILDTTVLVLIIFEITTEFPNTEQVGENWLPELIDMMQVTLVSMNGDGNVTVTVSEGVINLVV